MFKVIMLATVLTISGCVMVNPVSVLDSIKVLLDDDGNIITIIKDTSDGK